MGKRVVCWILLACFWMNMAGCGMQKGGSPDASDAALQEKTATEAVTEATTEPTTAPTLSKEEQLLQTLPERTRQAYEAGLVELEQLEDLERIVTIGEASAMMQKAYIHRTGVESKTLKELAQTPEYAQQTADRGWIFGVPGQVDMELTQGENYENYSQWLDYLNDEKKTDGLSDLWWCFDDRLNMMVYSFSEDGQSYTSDTPSAKDGDEFGEMMGEGTLYGPENPTTYAAVHEYGFKVYDSTTGEAFFQLEDGYIHPTKPLSVADAAEYALKFYNFPNPMEYPEFVDPENMSSYNPEIITAELLEKESQLPEASCQHLPEQWHGTALDNMTNEDRNFHTNDHVYEYEIQAIQEAGFNFVGIELDFNWLQEMVLQDSHKRVYRGFVKSEDVGKFSLSRLEQLDQVIAWCIQYDLHVDLRAVTWGGNNNETQVDINSKGVDKQFAKLWKAIAQRYADIPNKYLSFTILTTSGHSANSKALLPAVEAIQEVSPDRCIIADVYGWFAKKADAEVFAQQGVALACRIGGGDWKGFDIFGHRAMTSVGWGGTGDFKEGTKEIFQSFTWPYQGTLDAEAVMAQTGFYQVDMVMETAQEYGVGFMVSEFGITRSAYDNYINRYVCPNYRYPDEAYQAMLVDITSTLESRGYGWCFANWYGYFGIAAPAPIVEGATYEQVGEHDYYIDQTMLGWFREINGVA